MRRATLPEKPPRAARLVAKLAGAAALSVLPACHSDHHVSPWGQHPDTVLASYFAEPDLTAQLARVEAETAALGLRMTDEIRARLPARGGRAGSALAVVIRGYAGRDAGGRPVHATRVATDRGVVLAVGPLDAGDLDRREATELCRAVPAPEGGSGVLFQSGSDLAGDGAIAVVLRNDAGELAIWHVREIGSGVYPVTSAAPPTLGVDVDGDGRLNLWGEIPVDPADPIAPRLADVATFASGGYSDATAAARAWHARALEAATAPRTSTNVSDAVRLRSAIERTWHAILSGEPRETAAGALAREPVPRALRASFDRHLRTIAAIPPQ